LLWIENFIRLPLSECIYKHVQIDDVCFSLLVVALDANGLKNSMFDQRIWERMSGGEKEVFPRNDIEFSDGKKLVKEEAKAKQKVSGICLSLTSMWTVGCREARRRTAHSEGEWLKYFR
jgi:hypothetical protein